MRIFGRYDFEDPPMVMVTGEVRHPGQLVTNGQTRLRDALYQAGGVTRDAQLNDAQVFCRSADGKLKVLSVNLERALAGDAADNVSLQPKDRIFIHRNLAKFDPPAVKIEGEVARRGKYPLGEDMSAAQLVRLSGGLTRGAFTESADLTRYTAENGGQIVGEHVAVPLAHALAGDADSDVRLHDGDVLTIRQLAGWTDVGAVITVKGEVLHPGDYGIEDGERLSSVLKRAGGLRPDAYPYGAILERRQVLELEAKNRSDLIRQVQAQQSMLQLMPDEGDASQKQAKEAVLGQWQATLDGLRSAPPEGRLVIHISRNVGKWENTPADIQVRAGDLLPIPKTPTYIVVNGHVYNPTAITYRPGKSASWYLRQAEAPPTWRIRKESSWCAAMVRWSGKRKRRMVHGRYFERRAAARGYGLRPGESSGRNSKMEDHHGCSSDDVIHRHRHQRRPGLLSELWRDSRGRMDECWRIASPTFVYADDSRVDSFRERSCRDKRERYGGQFADCSAAGESGTGSERCENIQSDDNSFSS